MPQPHTTQQQTHSLLPWRISDTGEGEWEVSDAVGQVVCDNAKVPVPVDVANMQFIVTACNSHYALLEACKLVSEYYDLVKQNYPDLPGLIRGLELARAAVAQAEG